MYQKYACLDMCYRWSLPVAESKPYDVSFGKNELFEEIVVRCNYFCHNLHKHENFGFIGYGSDEFVKKYSGKTGLPASVVKPYLLAIKFVKDNGLISENFYLKDNG